MNLLSPSAKEAWKRTQRRRSFIVFGTLVFVLEVTVSGGLYLLKSEIRRQTARLQQEVNVVTAGSREEKKVSLAQKTKQLNGWLTAMKRNTALDYPWPITLRDLDSAAPGSIRFHSLNMSLANHKLTLNGFASNRDDLIAFQQALTALPILSGVNSPITNLLKRENIEFSITATFSAPTS